ncbi:hypothetical protein H0H93_016352, partial [Arthromyces matolae]
DGTDIVNNPLFDDSPTGNDHSTISSYHEDILTTPDHGRSWSTPSRHQRSPVMPTLSPHSPPSKLIGLGISGVPLRDGQAGNFDGLGTLSLPLARMRTMIKTMPPHLRFVYRRAQDDYDGGLHQDEKESDERLSETFTPQHTRSLRAIPEFADEEEWEFQLALKTAVESGEESSPSLSPLSLSHFNLIITFSHKLSACIELINLGRVNFDLSFFI